MAFDVEPENTFKDVYDLASAGIQSCISQIPEKVYIKDNMEKSGGVLVTLSLKISLCDELKSKFVDYLISLPSHSSSEEPVCNTSKSDKNVFDFMMASRKTLMFPEKPTPPVFDKTLTGPQKLFCDVLDWCKTIDDGWSKDQLICAKEILWKITNFLWYVNTHHDKFKTASCAIPKCFEAFTP
ncbi:hypothetical protein LOTGIDRAFT_163775 [Lottia gigantea]|uniref:Uncharacterized protein n=1 Tax=Lottia gigantea TaxID=225164 RepID=V4A2I6_LOTGI|nr:hypothetical protein LOTGIDRAFT_163775 [Lottia gigantea]ESO90887.1 hypothetical protein LOTGIDRAFT_163775 [Lottia gigantea]